jgi:hypothetical protein
MSDRDVLGRKSTPSFERSARDLKQMLKAENYFITSAQNDTPPDTGFLAAAEVWKRDQHGAIGVLPIRYKNPTQKSDPSEEQDDYGWDDRLREHMLENALEIAPGLVVQGDVRIQATARRPLSSLEARSKGNSAIYGHSQLAMQTIATPQFKLPKILYTTGSITQRNYSSTKMGNLAAFHHVNGAIIVERRGKNFFIREINWDGKGFYDLDRYYTPKGVFKSKGVASLSMGDSHVWFADPDVTEATFEADDSVTNVLKPDWLIWNDVLDAYSISPHHFKNPFTRIVKTLNGRGNLRTEFDDTIAYIRDHTGAASNKIVYSNHNEHVLYWLRAGEAHVEPENAELYYWLKWRMLQEAKMAAHGVVHPDPFELYARGKLPRTDFLGPDDSFRLHGVELGMHGHLGPNGARGSAANLSKIGTRSIIGHVHSPAIFEGCYAVGTSSRLRLEYNAGPSSWLNTHAVVHPNGRRQMIHILNGQWRG